MLRCGLICWSVALVSAARYWTFRLAVPGASVVTVTAFEAGDTLPAASTATTLYVCVDEGARPVTVNAVFVLVPTWVVPSRMRYPVTPTLSVEAPQASETVVLVLALTTRLVGAVGGVVSGTGGPVVALTALLAAG